MAEKRTTADAVESRSKASKAGAGRAAAKTTTSKAKRTTAKAAAASASSAKKTTAAKATAAKAAKTTTASTKKAAAKSVAATTAGVAATKASAKKAAPKASAKAAKATTTKAAAKATKSAKTTTSKASAAKKTTAKATTAKASAKAAKPAATKATTKSATKATTRTTGKTTAKAAPKSTSTRSAAKATAATAGAAAGSRRAATSSAKSAAKPSRAKASSATRSTAPANDTPTRAEATPAAQAAPAAAGAAAATAATTANTSEQSHRSRTGLVVLAALAVALIAGLLGLNMRGFAPMKAAEQPAAEQPAAEQAAEEADDGAAAEETAQAPAPQGETQMMEGAGMAFNLPAGWIKASETTDRVLFSPASPEDNSLVLAANYAYPGGVTLGETELETAVQQFAVGLLESSGYKGANVGSIERRIIGGMPAYQVRATADASGKPMELYSLAVGAANRLWTVIAGSDASKFAENQYIFEEVMSSMKVMGAEPATSASAAASTAALDVLRSFGEFDATTHQGTGTVNFVAPLYKMPFLMRVSHAGDGAFSITTQDDNNEWADTLVSAIGNYSGTISNYLFYDQCAYVTVAADPDEEWEVTFEPFTGVESLVNGGHYAGDGVYLVDSATLQQMRFAHEGAGQLTAWAFSLDGQQAYDQLFSQEGNFDITVPWDQGASVIMVNGDGNWSVSW